jgi:hypothetical protein
MVHAVSDRIRLAAALVLWFSVALAAGSFMSFYVGGHGAIVYLIFALALALSGSVASALSLRVKVLRESAPYVRFAIVELVASGPVLVLAACGLLFEESYPLRDAVIFCGIFVLPTALVAAVAEFVTHGSWRFPTNAA